MIKIGFQENLRHYREKAGYKQAKEFAKRLGISYTTYIAYENQGREPKYQLLIKIADILNISLDELLGRYNNIAGRNDNYLIEKSIQEALLLVNDYSRTQECSLNLNKIDRDTLSFECSMSSFKQKGAISINIEFIFKYLNVLKEAELLSAEDIKTIDLNKLKDISLETIDKVIPKEIFLQEMNKINIKTQEYKNYLICASITQLLLMQSFNDNSEPLSKIEKKEDSMKLKTVIIKKLCSETNMIISLAAIAYLHHEKNKKKDEEEKKNKSKEVFYKLREYYLKDNK